MDQNLDRQSLSNAPSALPASEGTPSPSELDIASPEICVICLELLADTAPVDTGTSRHLGDPKDRASEIATAYPCRHAQFHLPCLGTWLSHSPTCPLCKTVVASISVRRKGQSPELITLPTEPSVRSKTQPASLFTNSRPLPRRQQPIKNPIPIDPILTFRRKLYIQQIPSSYLGRGSVRISSERRSRRQPIRQPITPTSFSQSHNPNASNLLRLATIWIRRELQLFDFLQPSATDPSAHAPSNRRSASIDTSPFPTPRRRTTPHYLLPFILSVCQQIDLKRSAGQAVELIGEYLGKRAAMLFCHELHAFLSSGAESVGEWDGKVQYWFEDEGQGMLRNGRGEVLGRVGDDGG